MELIGDISSPKLLTVSSYARPLGMEASNTSCFSAQIVGGGGTILLQPPPEVFVSLRTAPVPASSEAVH